MPQLSSPVDKVVVTEEAAYRDDIWIQAQAKKIVWSTGCSSWFVDPKTGRNTQMYPDWQWKFWIRSFWYPKSDFIYEASTALVEREHTTTSRSVLPELLGIVTVVAGIVAAVSFASDSRRVTSPAKGRGLVAWMWKVVSI